MKKVVIAGMIGNGLEWYDYALYGYFASIISDQFFPKGDAYASLILTYGIFAAGFIMRPLGGVVFGWIGDKMGRKTSLAASVLLMAIPTACIGLLPSYASIGILAPILLTLLRLLQGLALGGELSGSITYVVEHAPPHKRGIIGSTSMISMMLGILTGSAVAAGFATFLSPEDFHLWGWRVPFLIGLVIGMIGLYMRSCLNESPAYEAAKAGGHLADSPIKEVFKHHYKEMLTAIGIYVAVTAPFYTQTVFMNGFMTNVQGFDPKDALLVNMISLVVLTLILPVSARLSDRYGRRRIFTYGAMAYLIFSYPAFWLIGRHDLALALVGQTMFASMIGFYTAAIPAMLVEIFPTRVRYTGMAIACNLAAAVFGGTAPMVETWLVKMTGNGAVVALYVMVCAVISLVALRFYEKPAF